MDTLLEVKDLSVQFNTPEGVIYAVNRVSFDLFPGETLAIVGESGSGKSVSTMSLLGLIPRISGKIASGTAIFNDGFVQKDLLKLSKKELRKVRGGQIGFIFQDPLNSLNPVMTIGQQIAESLEEHLGYDKEKASRQAVELLELVRIPDAPQRVHNYPHQLSGGMRQRVMIAIAIACLPKILIADEPTTALDVTIQAQIVDLVVSLRDKLNLSIIWITHDLGVVAGLADRVLVMYGGTVVELAQVDELYSRPSHPYTRGLLKALPRMNLAPGEKLANIPGVPPDITTPLAHCPFAARCQYVFDRCWQEVPPLVSLPDRHISACFLAEKLRSEHAD